MEKLYLKSSFLIASSKILKFVVNLLVFTYVVNSLGDVQFGRYSYFMAIASIVIVLAAGGLNEICVPELMQSRKGTAKSLANILILKLFYSIIGAVIAIIILPEEAIFYGLAVLFGFTTVFISLLEARAKGFFISLYQSISIFVFALLKLVALSGENKVQNLGLVFFLEVVSSGMAAFIYSYIKGYVEFSFEFGKLRGLISRSWPLWVSGAVSILYIRTDQLIIKVFLDESSLGVYSLGAGIVGYALLIPNMLLASMMGYFSVVSDERNEEDVYGYCLVISLALTFVTILITYFFLDLVFDAVFDGSKVIIYILSLCIPFVTLRVVSGKYFIVRRLYKYSMARSILSLALNGVMSIILVQYYGIFGVACGTLIASLFSGILFDLLFSKTRPYAQTKLRSMRALLGKKWYIRQIKLIRSC